jgi:hypothetical protein
MDSIKTLEVSAECSAIIAVVDGVVGKSHVGVCQAHGFYGNIRERPQVIGNVIADGIGVSLLRGRGLFIPNYDTNRRGVKGAGEAEGRHEQEFGHAEIIPNLFRKANTFGGALPPGRGLEAASTSEFQWMKRFAQSLPIGEASQTPRSKADWNRRQCRDARQSASGEFTLELRAPCPKIHV